MTTLREHADAAEDARARGGVSGALSRVYHNAATAMTFVRLYFFKAKTNEIPETVRLQPVW
ncbi:MAG: hypothetical protein AAFW81_10755 [Pseudomonadota bacterium]